MDKVKYVRRIDKLGRVALPNDVRSEIDWGIKTPVEILVNTADQEITLKRRIPTCAFCPATENLKGFNQKYICPFCQQAIATL